VSFKLASRWELGSFQGALAGLRSRNQLGGQPLDDGIIQPFRLRGSAYERDLSYSANHYKAGSVEQWDFPSNLIRQSAT
jgi:hypothetical protein